MSHVANVNIPARFSFRPFSATWRCGWADTVEWHDDKYANLFSFGRVREPVEQLRVSIAVLEDPEPVLETDSYNEPWQALSALFPLRQHSFYSVLLHRTQVPDGVLAPDHNRVTCPDIKGREFRVIVSTDGEPGHPRPGFQPGGPEKDAWNMRQEFLNLEEDDEALAVFLNRWGEWRYDNGYSVGLFEERPLIRLVWPHQVWKQRELYRAALVGKPHEWLCNRPRLNLTGTSKPPYFGVYQSYCGPAIEATITIDHLSKAKFGICKRADCQNLFQFESGHKRLYCSHECAHLANVRKLRAKQKREKQKARRNATRKS